MINLLRLFVLSQLCVPSFPFFACLLLFYKFRSWNGVYAVCGGGTVSNLGTLSRTRRVLLPTERAMRENQGVVGHNFSVMGETSMGFFRISDSKS